MATTTTTPKVSIFEKILHGLEWFGKEIGKVFSELPKIITLTDDAEQAATTALPEVLAVVKDAGTLVTATAKDSGAFFTAFATLAGAITAAYAAKALNIAADTAVVAAFEQFCSEFKAENVSDVLTAWHQLAMDSQTLDATVVATLKKMEADAKA